MVHWFAIHHIPAKDLSFVQIVTALDLYSQAHCIRYGKGGPLQKEL